jgi:hypothetical protein
MLAVYEPSFDVFTLINVLPDLLADDVSARIRRAAVVRCPFAPINIDESESSEEVKCKLLKIRR